jgi:hypothetical protein
MFLPGFLLDVLVLFAVLQETMAKPAMYNMGAFHASGQLIPKDLTKAGGVVPASLGRRKPSRYGHSRVNVRDR